jgi:hypothetical protein
MQADQATPGSAPLAAGRMSRRIALGLAALCALALVLRLLGIGSMLPQVPQVDEQILYTQVCVEDGLDLPVSKQSLPFAYPTLVAKVLHAVVPKPGACVARTTEEHVECATKTLVWMRVWLAIAAALGVPLLFFLARRVVPDPVALMAATWLAFSVLHAWYSSQARPHAVLCTLVVLAVLSCVELRRRGDARSYVLAGIATALAASTLQSGVFVVPAFVVAHFLRKRGSTGRPWLWFAAALALVVASVVLFNRHGARDPNAPLSSGSGLIPLLLDKMHGLDLSDFTGHGFGGMFTGIVQYDPWLGAFAGVGLVVVITRVMRSRELLFGTRGRDAAVLLAHGLTHVVAFGMFDRTFQRFLMPVVPYMCLLAAVAVAWIASALASGLPSARPRKLATGTVVVLALAPQIFAGIKVAWLHAAPDTLSSAAAWIRTNLDREHARIAVAPTLELALLRRPEGLPRYLGSDALTFSLWTDYQIARESVIDPAETWSLTNVPLARQIERDRLRQDPDAFVRALDADYVVVDVNHDDRRQILDVLRQAVMRHGHLVAHFGPREPTRAGDVPILYHLDGPLAPDAHFAWRVAIYAAQGPDVEIYALDR